MTTLLVHDTTTPWHPTDPALDVTVGTGTLLDREVAVNRLRYDGGPAAAAEFAPAAPLDLTDWEELRLWIRADPPAHGTPQLPFYLALSYTDAQDSQGSEHRWFIPVNDADTWEHCPIGIGDDRRGAITRFRLETIGGTPFTAEVYQLRAVREEMLGDIERALVDALSGLRPPGLDRVPLLVSAAPGDQTVEPAYASGFAPGNRILLQGGQGPDEEHDVVQVTNGSLPGRTRLAFAADSPVRGGFPAGGSSVSVTVPVELAASDSATGRAVPRVEVSGTEVREDADRSGYARQRDSFRPSGPLTVCAVRPPARAYTADYRITVAGTDPGQRTAIHNGVLSRLSNDRPLWIDDMPAPVWMLPVPWWQECQETGPGPVRIRVGSRMQTGPREVLPLVRRSEVRAGRPDTPEDDEGMAPRP
ncbi:hypothetical protein [Streptomyces palmae]|uniref:Uncharacterized protein n=1 Tax=Streptomyces palmae TaxID=1701085 RepID=A0A4Z0HF17_9ACTN|nr:hypothetical protein [Streptomyces palmae]TGB13738.1 hypothetical protein E4099_09550 [Streptomyces palmae]